ncbi:prickle-like protein 4 isoform X2 [Rhinatrema bivittatum]|uniref:prickle-like protein 4 isoform X2 n=2 Tax=Rhinatrema bivittatum TaxID=194408 RepID=UPI00112C8B72|nr:prickle-like protein 4 isoform X2 [Rhinatrema bivittatum]
MVRRLLTNPKCLIFFNSSFPLMAVLSPVWHQRASAPCNGSDSGCVLEEEHQNSPDLKPVEFNSPMADEIQLKTLLSQLPPQDCDERYCHWFLGQKERRELQRFSAWRRLNSLGQAILQPMTSLSVGSCCYQCGRYMKRGNMVAVWASRLGEHCWWHPSCFICAICCQPLLHLIYFHQDGEIYCGRHHAELFKPRCAACDQLIFTEELVEAEGWHWHLEHFRCTDCEEVLGGHRYIMKTGRPYCCDCFQSLDAETCQRCGDHRGLDCEHISYQGQHWHAQSSCFFCDLCQKSLMGSTFTPRDRQLDWNQDSGTSEGAALRTSSESAKTGSDASESAPHQQRSPSINGTSIGTQDVASEPLAVLLQGHKSAQNSSPTGKLALRKSKPEWEGQPSSVRYSWAPTGTNRQALQHSPPCSAFSGRWQRDAGEDKGGCSTCSSSSDSEQEGCFFGKPIPNARVTDSTCHGQDWYPMSDAPGRQPLQTSRDPESKKCTIC